MIKKYFGTDGIRGKVNREKINGEMFFKFGLAAGTYFNNQKKTKQVAIIAKDTRLSGYTLEPGLVSGLTSGGMHVFKFGPLPTNGLAMLTKKMSLLGYIKKESCLIFNLQFCSWKQFKMTNAGFVTISWRAG